MRRYLQHSVSRKLGFAVAATLTALAAIFVYALMRADRGGRNELTDDYLALINDNVLAILAAGDEDGHGAAFDDFRRYVTGHGPVGEVQVLDNDGMVFLTTGDEVPGEPAAPELLGVLDARPGAFSRIHGDDGSAGSLVQLENEEPCQGCHEASVSTLGYLYVTASGSAAIDQVVLRFQRLLALLAVLPVIVTLVVLSLLVRRFVGRPLESLADAMDKAGQGENLVRAPVRSSDEFGRLAESFNRMLSEITALHARQMDTVMELQKVQDELQVQSELGARTQSVEEANRQLEARLRELGVLYRMSRGIASRRSLEELFTKLTEIVGEELGFREFALLLLDSKTNTLTVRATFGFDQQEESEIAGMTFEIGQGVSGEVARTGEPILIEDTRKDSRFLHYKGKHLADGAFLSIPLKVGNRVVAVMNFLRSSLESFSRDEVRFLQAVGDQIAVAIDNVKLYQRLTELSSTDALTGLPNRRIFTERLGLEVKRANRFDRQLALLMIDIDFFKNYNDTHGHVEGDDLLRKFANVLASNVREVDMVARYGGEEFVVVLPNTDLEEALGVGEKLRSRVAGTRFRNAKTQPDGRITISVGLAAYPDHAGDAQQLVLYADMALYRAKETGRNRVVVFDEKLQSALERARS